jgi:hypothetical protein
MQQCPQIDLRTGTGAAHRRGLADPTRPANATVPLIGPLRIQFWVWGRFDVHDGRITLWRDSFDFVDVLRGVARGIVALAVPALRPAGPRGPDAAPGR